MMVRVPTRFYDRLVQRCIQRWVPTDAMPWRRFPQWRDIPPAEWYDWRWQWRHRLRSLEDLVRAGLVSPQKAASLQPVVRAYPLIVSPYYVSLIERPDSSDPIWAQAVPTGHELNPTDLTSDPLGERRLEAVPGLIHRYRDRALLIVSNVCTTFCRHCFRKRILGRPGVTTAVRHLEMAIAYIRTHPEIRDVILSGGDPLTLSTRTLTRILRALRSIPHVAIIRLGTRVPVTMPMRLWDPKLLAVLDRYGPIWCVTQFNHPREITPEAQATVQILLRVGVPVLNQTVILRGINDDVETMRTLHMELVRACVKPYYLHQADPIRGTAHFRTHPARGVAIMEGLRGHISGLAVPTFVIDLPDGGGKVPVEPSYVISMKEDAWILRNYRGERFVYPTEPGRSGRRLVSMEPVSVH